MDHEIISRKLEQQQKKIHATITVNERETRSVDSWDRKVAIFSAKVGIYKRTQKCDVLGLGVWGESEETKLWR